jgi:aspartyl-tRNA(Asn)/glutamyl-tRNA(Gln) amidotransferase subunit B
MEIRMAELFEKVAREIDPKLAARWLRRELARVMNYSSIEFADLGIDETHLIELLSMVEKKEITETVAQKLLEKLVEKPFSVREYVRGNGLAAVTDTSALESFCREAISESPDAADDVRAGSEKAINFIIGKVMRKTRGTANPAVVKELLKKLI